MNTFAPVVKDQSAIDSKHINLLSVFHFVGVGFGLLGLLFLYGHYMLMSSVINNPQIMAAQKGAPSPAEFFAIFKWFYVIFGIWFLVSAVLNLISGLFLRARKHRLFSLIVAGFNCLHMPLGTVLGVFTFIVLLRDSVRQAYEQGRG